jgi:hypothetical protein
MLSSVEVCESTSTTWETVQSIQARSNFNVVVAEGELYALGGYGGNISIEKLDKELSVWRIVTEIEEVQMCCGIAVLDSKIYVLGGVFGGQDSSWNSFDVLTGDSVTSSTVSPALEAYTASRFLCG